MSSIFGVVFIPVTPSSSVMSVVWFLFPGPELLVRTKWPSYKVPRVLYEVVSLALTDPT